METHATSDRTEPGVPDPQGTRHEISAGGYTAVIAEVGASLVSLTGPHGHLVRTTPPGHLRTGCNGAILAPWPNRIRDGRYSFGGQTHQLPLTEPGRGNASHGLALWQRWSVADGAGDGPETGTEGDDAGPGAEAEPGADADAESAVAEFSLDLVPQPGYPFSLRLTARYAVSAAGLRWEVTAENTGGDDAPYAVAGHPYLVADGSDGDAPGSIPGWRLSVPAAAYLEADPDRLLPVAEHRVDGGVFDFRGGRVLGDTAYDIALGEIERDADGGFSCALTHGEEARGVVLRCGPGIRWVQVYTDDKPHPEDGRRAVAVEPMTAPADAFRSGRDLTVLEPGERHAAWWTIAETGW
ncbi:aldose 1-epimerase family protein [Rothia sp. AR01]|uniref:Aldose 1-epimerase family protein n=1 Tax=Rothia santali TaxID=2949643 RepID=A0A9X2KI12_9MICC|nr:aldose 1-epimerase family protein [Rothia santali]MCP3425364.1 aldose 1-epimerase family protein [Rothia santali]